MTSDNEIVNLMEYFEVNRISPRESLRQMLILMGKLIMLSPNKEKAVEEIKEFLLMYIREASFQEELPE